MSLMRILSLNVVLWGVVTVGQVILGNNLFYFIFLLNTFLLNSPMHEPGAL